MNIQVTPPSILDEMLQAIASKPYAIDLFALMRRLEVGSNAIKWGYANKYRDEKLQFGQEPSSIFASASIAKLYQYSGSRKPKLAIHSFGLFGPNGAMPLVFTEYVKERMAHHNDYALSDFIDIFHNRLIMLFYRAWADANSCASLDKCEENFTRYIASLCASGLSSLHQTDAIPTHARWHNAGHLLRQSRNANGLKSILSGFFKVPVHIQEFVAHWLPLPTDEQTRLGNIKGTQLGFDAILGRKVMTRQQHFQIQLGPLTLDEYNQFLPNTAKFTQLRDWVRSYAGVEFTWDLCLILNKSIKNIGLSLGKEKYLGWNSWLGNRNENQSTTNHTASVIFHPESVC
ncbi:type VI secretion system baseplate subunit TssG [Cellvibrio sp. pealriver]|uniref:type VI secretion system baseplate subunit TssG n=1 Tax=Cellvibrio sp. pealriver TaxID=1622269 RepID=UPI00066FDB63|nr:type VI secretion system baseplate subunit TssG [Cellvibrio sp. pealriver]